MSRLQPPNASLELNCARADGRLQRYRVLYQQRGVTHPCLRTYSSCSLHMLVILLIGTNRMNSCRSTANHERLASALPCAASGMPNNLQRPCCTPSQDSTHQLACLPACLPACSSSSQGELFKFRKSGVRSKPHAKGAVLNSAAAALHMPSDETVVQTQHTTAAACNNPHDSLFYPIPPYRRASQTKATGGETMGVS